MSNIFLLTGLSGAGKTTLAKGLCCSLPNCILLDGDEIRKGLCNDLGFTSADREENIRRCGELAKLLANQGATVILAMIAPYQKARDNLKQIVGSKNLHIIHIDCPLEICIERDPKHNYKKAREGLLKNYTGLGDQYEVPLKPDLVINTNMETPEQSLATLVQFAREKLKVK